MVIWQHTDTVLPPPLTLRTFTAFSDSQLCIAFATPWSTQAQLQTFPFHCPTQAGVSESSSLEQPANIPPRGCYCPKIQGGYCGQFWKSIVTKSPKKPTVTLQILKSWRAAVTEFCRRAAIKHQQGQLVTSTCSFKAFSPKHHYNSPCKAFP